MNTGRSERFFEIARLTLHSATAPTVSRMRRGLSPRMSERTIISGERADAKLILTGFYRLLNFANFVGGPFPSGTVLETRIGNQGSADGRARAIVVGTSDLLGRPARASLGLIGPRRPSIPLEGAWETMQETIREDEPVLVSPTGKGLNR